MGENVGAEAAARNGGLLGRGRQRERVGTAAIRIQAGQSWGSWRRARGSCISCRPLRHDVGRGCHVTLHVAGVVIAAVVGRARRQTQGVVFARGDLGQGRVRQSAHAERRAMRVSLGRGDGRAGRRRRGLGDAAASPGALIGGQGRGGRVAARTGACVGVFAGGGGGGAGRGFDVVVVAVVVKGGLTKQDRRAADDVWVRLSPRPTPF